MRHAKKVIQKLKKRLTNTYIPVIVVKESKLTWPNGKAPVL